MEGGRRGQHVVEDEEDEVDEVENEEEEEGEIEEENVEVFDDRAAMNVGVDDGIREREMRLNAIGEGADDDAPPRDPIVIDLGTPIYPIQVGDLPLHGSEYREILRTCPPLQED